MKIEKLPSGSYRIRKMYKGRMHTVIFDYRPTQKEAMQAMAAELDKGKNIPSRMNFKRAAESYVDMKLGLLHKLQVYHLKNLKIQKNCKDFVSP